MNPESTSVAQAISATDDSTEAPVALDAAVAPVTQNAAVVPTAQEPTRVRPPGGTLRLTFKLRLEDAREVLLDLDDKVDFRHGAYQSVAPVGDQVRKVFEAIVAEPLLTTVNQYVRLKLDAGLASVGTGGNPGTSSFPQFPSPNVAEPDGHPFSGPEDS
jgi:hypothetical protein